MGYDDHSTDERQVDLLEIAYPLVRRWRLLIFGSLLAGATALALTYVIPPTFTARTSFLPPQQGQSSAASALAALGSLGALAGAATGSRTPSDQYVALLLSVTVMDRMIDRFALQSVYGEELRTDARRELGERVRASVGKRDGIIYLEADDVDPARAAALANGYVDELRRLTSKLALTEAQQRRQFFEEQLDETRQRLERAQLALQDSGISAGTLRAEPRTAAESYARLRANVGAAEVQLQALRQSLTDSAPEVQQALSVLRSQRAQLAAMEANAPTDDETGYIGRFREFKYQETLFELYARQFELARLDESKEGVLIQVIDQAFPPEKRSSPKRRIVLIVTIAAVLLLLALYVVADAALRRALVDPALADRLATLRGSIPR